MVPLALFHMQTAVSKGKYLPSGLQRRKPFWRCPSGDRFHVSWLQPHRMLLLSQSWARTSGGVLRVAGSMSFLWVGSSWNSGSLPECNAKWWHLVMEAGVGGGKARHKQPLQQPHTPFPFPLLFHGLQIFSASLPLSPHLTFKFHLGHQAT